MLGDLKDPRWIIAKGGLFLLAGVMASGLLLWEQPSLRVAALHALAVWCFCRFYYFAFYVLQHYVDDSFRFAGLGSALTYLWRRTHRASLKSPQSGTESASREPPADSG